VKKIFKFVEFQSTIICYDSIHIQLVFPGITRLRCVYPRGKVLLNFKKEIQHIKAPPTAGLFRMKTVNHKHKKLFNIALTQREKANYCPGPGYIE